MDPTRASGETPLSVLLCDLACVGFALWTVCANVVVAFGGHLLHLLAVFGLALPVAGWAGWAGLARSRSRPRPPREPSPPEPAGGFRRRAVLRAAGALLGGAALARFAVSPDPVELWWSAVLLLGAASLWVPVAAGDLPVPLRGRGAEAWLWGLALSGAVLALVAHRHDLDDSFYVNLAVSVADEPTRTLLANDTLRGIPDLPFSNPTQRAQSYELLVGALSWATGVPAIVGFHWIAAPLAALWLPLAAARLLRILAPGHWPWALAALVALLLAWGDTHRAYGNFAFVRLWHGKAIFLHALLPLVYAYALRFASRRDAGSWWLLCAAQVAALGFTSTALWAAPLSAGLALAAAVTPDARGLRTAALGLLASGYVLAVALLLKGQVPAELVTSEGLGAVGQQLRDSLHAVLGREGLQGLGAAALLLTWCALPAGRARRFAVVVPLGALLVVANPYTESFVRAHVTGPTQWRTLWALPVPLLAALLCCAPIPWASPGASPRRRLAGRGLAAAAVAFCVLALPQRTTLGPRPGFRLAAPSLKVNPVAYAWARAIQRSVPPGSQVLAPTAVNPWIPTLHRHPYPLEIRPDFHWDMEPEDAELRFALTRWVSGELRVDGAPERLRRGIERYRLAAVCLVRHAGAEEIRDVLREAGFRRAAADRVFELWLPAAGEAP